MTGTLLNPIISQSKTKGYNEYYMKTDEPMRNSSSCSAYHEITLHKIISNFLRQIYVRQ